MNLRDELLDAFESLPDLRASEVLILAPQLDLYGPLAEAILRDGDPSLPLRLAERRIDRSEPLVRGMHTLLRVAAGRVPLSEGLALLALFAPIDGGRSAWHACGWVSREPGRPRRLHRKDRRGAGTGSPSPRPWTQHLASDGAKPQVLGWYRRAKATKRGGMDGEESECLIVPPKRGN